MQFLLFMNKPYFNGYDLILFMTFFQSVIFSIMLLLRQEKTERHYLLPAFMLSIGLGQLCFFFTYNPLGNGAVLHAFSMQAFSIFALVFYLQGPLLYAYMRSLTDDRYELKWVDIAPIAVFLVAVNVGPMQWFKGFLETLFWRDYIFVGVTGFFVSTIYGIKCVLHMRLYAERLQDRFCTIESMDFYWLKVFAWGFLFIWFLELLPPFVYHTTPWWLAQIVTHAAGLLELLMVNFMVFSSLLYSKNILKMRASETTRPAGDTAIAEALVPREIQQIDTLMQDEQLYRTSGLVIEDLAARLDLPVKQLSHIINRHYEKNFYEFVNHYRVEESRRLLKDPGSSHRSIQDIYEAVGFRSKSSFNTLFKKWVGMTPSQYREKYGR